MKIDLTESTIITLVSALRVAGEAERARSKSWRTEKKDRPGHVKRAERFDAVSRLLLVQSALASFSEFKEQKNRERKAASAD